MIYPVTLPAEDMHQIVPGSEMAVTRRHQGKDTHSLAVVVEIYGPTTVYLAEGHTACRMRLQQVLGDAMTWCILMLVMEDYE